MYQKEDAMLKLSFDFAIQIIQLSKEINNKSYYSIANQVLRSGTSIGANIREVKHAESRADFIHKLKIASKEASENEYWLLLCKQIQLIECEELLNDLNVIMKILSKAIATAKKNNH
jgi:four helix bundle protein